MPIPLTARDPVEFEPPALAARIAAENVTLATKGLPAKPAVKIIIRVPTMYERDAFTAALVRGGVIHYNKAQIRELMLAAAVFLYGEDRFDEVRADLEHLWQAGDAMVKAGEQQQQRYIELMEQQLARQTAGRAMMTDDEMEADLQKIVPEVTITETARVRITAMQQDMTARYEPLQKAYADLAEQSVRRSWLCIELYVTSWLGLSATPTGNGRGGITRPEAEWLRSQIGADAFEQVADLIFAMQGLDEDEEKNLASLIESSSVPTGSTQTPEAMSETEYGSSTDAPSTPTPDIGSATTIASSSPSTISAKATEDASPPTLTDDPSSTNP